MTSESKKVRQDISSSSKRKPQKKLRVPERQEKINADELVWPVLHKRAFRGWIGEFVKLVCKNSEADPAAVLVTVLLRFAASVFGPYVYVGDDKHMSRTNAVIVGNTSKSREGTASRAVNRLFDGVKNSVRTTTDLISSGVALFYHVRDETVNFDKKSGESISTGSGIKDKRLFINNEDLGAALSNIKGVGKDITKIIQSLYDPGCAETVNKDITVRTTNAHVVIVTQIMKDDLILHWNKAQMGNGYFNRFLWVLVKRQQLVALPEPMPKLEIAQFQKTIERCIENSKAMNAADMTENAKHLWEKSYAKLSADLEGRAGSVVNRSETHAIRLALIYALADGENTINTGHIKAALALVKYSRESALIIFNDSSKDKYKVKLLQALRTAPKNTMCRTEIYALFGNNKGKEVIDKIIRELESLEIVSIKTSRTNDSRKGREEVTLRA